MCSPVSRSVDGSLLVAALMIWAAPWVKAA
jgi:hypothetical protein